MGDGTVARASAASESDGEGGEEGGQQGGVREASGLQGRP